MENGELVPLILQEEIRGITRPQLEPVGARNRVLAWQGALGHLAAAREEPARLVGRLRLRVCDELLADGFGHYHQTAFSIARSTSSASQSGADRYFQPPSANTVTTTPSSSSSASRRATWITPPEETPAKIPSSSRSARMPATASALDTSSFRSSWETSRIGGTCRCSSGRRPWSGAAGGGGA